MRRSDKAERRTTKANRHIEKDSVGAHGEAAALRWRAADRFNPKTGINERIAKTGQRGAHRCGDGSRREPQQRKAKRFNDDRAKRDLGAAKAIRQLPEEETRRDQRAGESRENQSDRAPAALMCEQRAERENRAISDAAERGTEAGQPDGTDDLQQTRGRGLRHRGCREWRDDQ